MPPIIDTHQHLWDLGRFHVPWLQSEPELHRSFVTEDYLVATTGLNVVKSVYMEVDVAVEQQLAEAEYVIDLCRDERAPTAGAVISGSVACEGFRDYISRFKDNALIKGVRQVLHVESAKPGRCLGADFVRGIQLLGESGKSFDLCMRPTELADAVTLADLCPDTLLIIDHCGNADPKAFGAAGRDAVARAWHKPDDWRRAMSALAQRDHVICKISGIVVRATKGTWTADHLAPIINHCLDEFGPERVVFGGDWPVCTLVADYRSWFDALSEVVSQRPQADRHKLFHDNAVRFYDLS